MNVRVPGPKARPDKHFLLDMTKRDVRRSHLSVEIITAMTKIILVNIYLVLTMWTCTVPIPLKI